FDTMFNSYPVVMALLIKIVRGNPAMSIDDSTEQFGRATAAWYTERNLARTEERTLWLPNAKPRLLATTSDEHSLASVKPSESEKPAKVHGTAPPPGDLPSA